MKAVVVGTAGHIDHGKTALVKSLTGIDADRLQEEKRRGITIDLGFAHAELRSPEGGVIRLGFIDVPGHERFVRNMLAGVGGIDLVLLVVAADESIKPQTREHFDICRLLNIRRGLAVVTKADLVDAETLEVVRLEVEDFLRGSFLEGSPIIPVSARTGLNIDRLRTELARLAAATPARDSDSFFRLPIDRVFTMKGFGTVVTGTLVSGQVRKDEELELFPGGRRVRVRGIQVHNLPADEAHAGERTALNLAGVATADLARGMTLATAGRLRATRRADAKIELLPGVRPVRDHTRVHFHCYSSETIAQLRVQTEGGTAARFSPQIEEKTRDTQNGRETVFLQLLFREPQLLLPGDRFILRQFSPVVTIGGGLIVDAFPLRVRNRAARQTEAWLADLRLLAGCLPAAQLAMRVRRRGIQGASLTELIAETGCTPEQLERSVSRQPGGEILCFRELLIAAPAFAALRNGLVAAIAAFHQAHPLVGGINREELREKLGVPAEVFEAALHSLMKDNQVRIAGEQVQKAGSGIVLGHEEADSKRRIEEAFAGAGLKVPALKDILAGLKVDRARAQQIVTLLLREKVLIKVSDDLVFHRDALAQLRRMMAEYKKSSQRIDVGRFKDLAGITRKYAIPLLEYLDRERVTRRSGDERILL